MTDLLGLEMNRKHVAMIKRYCIHEAGHAIVAHELGIPVKGLNLTLLFDGDLMRSDGV